MSQAQEVLESAVKNQPKLCQTKWGGCFRGCLITVLVLVVPLVWFNIPAPLRISKETTYILGPMMPDGKRIDYFRAMEELRYPPEMKTDDNGYRLIVHTFGVVFPENTPGTNEHIHRQQVYDKLGLDMNEEPTRKIESPLPLLDETQKAKFEQVPFWTFDDFPMLENWLEANSASIDLFAEAVRKPAFCVPFTRPYENTSLCVPRSWIRYVDWQYAVAARAKYRLGIGNIDGAIDDVMTLYHFGRHIGKQGELVAWAVGGLAEMEGYSIGIGSNPEFPPTKEQFARLLAELDALPPRWGLGKSIEPDRYYALAAIQETYWKNSNIDVEPCCGGSFWDKYMTWGLDFNVFMERTNERQDKWNNDDFDVKIYQPSWNPLPYLTVQGRTQKFCDNMVVSFAGIFEKRGRQRECMENMYRLTLAHLAGIPGEKWLRCPSHPGLAEGETSYIMLADAPDQILFVEISEPKKLGSHHFGGFYVGYRSGAVRLWDKETPSDELQKLLDGTATEMP